MLDNYKYSKRVKINVSHSLVFDYRNATKLHPNFEFELRETNGIL